MESGDDESENEEMDIEHDSRADKAVNQLQEDESDGLETEGSREIKQLDEGDGDEFTLQEAFVKPKKSVGGPEKTPPSEGSTASMQESVDSVGLNTMAPQALEGR